MISFTKLQTKSLIILTINEWIIRWTRYVEYSKPSTVIHVNVSFSICPESSFIILFREVCFLPACNKYLCVDIAVKSQVYLMHMYITCTWFTVTTHSIQGLVQGHRVYSAPVSRSIVLLWESVPHFLAVCIFSFLKDSIDFESFVPRATKHPLNGVTVWHSQLALPYTHHIIITYTSQNDSI